MAVELLLQRLAWVQWFDLVAGVLLAGLLLAAAARLERRLRIRWLTLGLGLYLGASLVSFGYHGGVALADLPRQLASARYLLDLTIRGHPDALRLWTLPPWGLVPDDLRVAHHDHLLLGSVYNMGFTRLLTALLALCGGTVVAPALLLAAFAFSGLVAGVQAVRQAVPNAEGMAWAAAWPSVIFWLASLTKDGFVFGTLGWATWLLFTWAERGRAARIGIGLLLLVAYTVKPYIVLAFALALLFWPLLWAVRHRPWWTLPVVAIVGGAAGLALLSLSTFNLDRIWLELDWSRYEQTILNERQSRLRITTFFELGLPLPLTAGNVLLYSPWAMVTGLFRPWPWDVGTWLILPFAVESLGFAGALVWQSRQGLDGRAWRSRPWAISFILFAVGYATILGLSVMFFGSLVRYRAGLWVFLWLGVLALRRNPASLPHDPLADRRAPAR